MHYSIQIVGSPDDGFTSAELLDGDEPVGRVFQRDAGWYIELPDLDKLREPELIDSVLAARDRLMHYVNRKGGDMDGFTRAGASLWLMQRDDGKGFTIPESAG